MNNKVSILVCRAFGDFVIVLHLALKNHSNQQYTLFVSNHLYPLYNSLSPTLPTNLTIEWVNLNIRNRILFFFSKQNWIELVTLRKWIKQYQNKAPIYLEQSKRLLGLQFFCNSTFKSIIQGQYVYQQYAQFFSTELTKLENIKANHSMIGCNVLILPDSRQSIKTINEQLIENIKSYFQITSSQYTLARFGKEYSNFDELIQLIRSADWVIGADSLPIHLAQFYNVPHFIVYPGSKKNLFFTPFALKHLCYVSFEILEKQVPLQTNGN
jgi:hypothetical protein